MKVLANDGISQSGVKALEEAGFEVLKNGGNAVLTNNDHKTGTDRIFEAYKKIGKNNVDYILNLQGDEPNINKNDIINLNRIFIFLYIDQIKLI